jgi:cardiolipin synthase
MSETEYSRRRSDLGDASAPPGRRATDRSRRRGVDRLRFPRIFERGLRRITEAPLIPGNSAQLLVNAPIAYPGMLDVIRSARHTINFENYIIRGDSVGREFAEALTERASAGVTVRVLYDWFGSLTTSRSLWRALEKAGGEVRSYGAPSVSRPLRVFSRDHRKLMVVDGTVGVVGGLCIGTEWTDDGGQGCWRDTAVRIDGPVVTELDRAFARMWRKAGGKIDPRPIVRPEPAGDVLVRVVDSPPTHARAYRLYQLVSALAERTLYVTGAYPLAPSPLRRALGSAARAGVDVRLLVPGRSDLKVLNNAARAHYTSLLRSGVRIFAWNGPMLHAKSVVVDRKLCLIGSSNLNPISMMGCYELDVEIQDPNVAGEMHRQFLQDIETTEELTITTWKGRSKVDRLAERVGAALLWLPYKLYSG